ncbi:unnamed protein product [Dovyalis caffra]|uniref:Uncharacterized protein n=1 Tax=Dovyalis caffra TaxID=77055 RepID=A0AAV1RMI3_9ROSI|nr:unnamed protein product [Dovyalis caffra]
MAFSAALEKAVNSWEHKKNRKLRAVLWCLIIDRSHLSSWTQAFAVSDSIPTYVRLLLLAFA